MKRWRGYTLIELIIIVAILSIILVMTIPNTGYFRCIRETNELKEFKRDILFARNKAIIDSKIYTLRFLNEDNGYIIESSHPSDFKKTKYFEHGIVLSGNNNIKKILFHANGTISNSGTISFKNRNGKEYELIITPIRGLVDIREAD